MDKDEIADLLEIKHRELFIWLQKQPLVSYDYSVITFNPSYTDKANYTSRMELLKDF